MVRTAKSESQGRRFEHGGGCIAREPAFLQAFPVLDGCLVRLNRQLVEPAAGLGSKTHCLFRAHAVPHTKSLLVAQAVPSTHREVLVVKSEFSKSETLFTS